MYVHTYTDEDINSRHVEIRFRHVHTDAEETPPNVMLGFKSVRFDFTESNIIVDSDWFIILGLFK